MEALGRRVPTPIPTSVPTPSISYIKLDKATLDSFNPLLIEQSPVAAELSKPGTFISRSMDFLFPIAGASLFVMLIWAGFEMMATAATKKSIDTGKQRAFAAITGLLSLYVLYWVVQILEMVFSINILGN